MAMGRGLVGIGVVSLLLATSFAFRPPAVPIMTFAPMHELYLFDEKVERAGNTKYWNAVELQTVVMLRIGEKTFQLLGENKDSQAHYAHQEGMPEPLATQTTIHFKENISATTTAMIDLVFTNPLLLSNLTLFSRPVAYITANVRFSPLPPVVPDVILYVDSTAQHCVHLKDTAAVVAWDQAPTTGARGAVRSIRMGTQSQKVLQSCGDQFMLDWGYVYLAAPANGADAAFTAGTATECRAAFAKDGKLPPIDRKQPRPISDKLPAIAVAAHARRSGPDSVRAMAMYAYDEIYVMYYFGTMMRPLWQRAGYTFTDMLDDAAMEAPSVLGQCAFFDASLKANITRDFSERYALLASLAYRQSLAALQLSHNDKLGEDWAFQKEISSDGDINTMDVIFPASPLLLWLKPELIKQLLLPILRYANNETWKPFTDPYSPHHLGVYPIANLSAKDQEEMPMENTANMFLMLLAYGQRTNKSDAFFKPFWKPVLRPWAEYMIATQLPDPPKQICTDDFAGPLRHSTNLAAKGIVALQAFYELCVWVGDTGCEMFRGNASQFAAYWVKNSYESDGDGNASHTHTKLAYDLKNTWSTKYNVLWQKILGFKDEPFPNYDALCDNEVRYYQTHMTKYGFPMDSRHSYQKLDWLIWGSALSTSRSTFVRMAETAYTMADETGSRWPLTDLYDTNDAKIHIDFRSRPVVGALFAPYLLSFRK